MLGRIANFINGELLGKIVAQPGEPAPWWAVKFPQEVFSGHDAKLNHEQNLKLWAIIDQFRIGTEADKVAYERAVRTLQGGGEKAAAVAKQLEPILSSRYPSQLMQAVTDGLVLGLVLWLIWWKPRKPGVIGCWFMIVYGVMRIATEFVRLPDTQLQGLKDKTGLSMGQWLSVLMVVGGAAGLVFMSRRDVPKMGGWGKAWRAKAAD
jgi:phosphatidylglycerol:prolipoprotein diacylglycerol transferase